MKIKKGDNVGDDNKTALHLAAGKNENDDTVKMLIESSSN